MDDDREMILFIYFLHDFLLPVRKRRSSKIPGVNEIPVLSQYNAAVCPPRPYREAAPKTTSSSAPCRAWSATST